MKPPARPWIWIGAALLAVVALTAVLQATVFIGDLTVFATAASGALPPPTPAPATAIIGHRISQLISGSLSLGVRRLVRATILALS